MKIFWNATKNILECISAPSSCSAVFPMFVFLSISWHNFLPSAREVSQEVNQLPYMSNLNRKYIQIEFRMIIISPHLFLEQYVHCYYPMALLLINLSHLPSAPLAGLLPLQPQSFPVFKMSFNFTCSPTHLFPFPSEIKHISFCVSLSSL